MTYIYYFTVLEVINPKQPSWAKIRGWQSQIPYRGFRGKSIALYFPAFKGHINFLAHWPFLHLQNEQCGIFKSPSNTDFFLLIGTLVITLDLATKLDSFPCGIHPSLACIIPSSSSLLCPLLPPLCHLLPPFPLVQIPDTPHVSLKILKGQLPLKIYSFQKQGCGQHENLYCRYELN